VPLPNRSTGEALRTLGAVSSVGLAFVLSIVMGAALGYGADRLFGTSPWLFLAGFVVGFAAGVLSVIRVVTSASRSGRR
jgi:ATP synthase protein I